MEIAPSHSLMQVTQEEMERVRQHFNLDRKKIQMNLNAIADWIKKEKHLEEASKYLDSNILERLYINEKGSVERTKIRIDRLLTTRGMIPELCLINSIKEFDEFSRNVIFVPLPKLHPTDLTRVTVVQMISEKGNETNMLTYLRYVFLIIDYTMRIEYTLGQKYILDLNHFNLSGLAQLNPFAIKKGEVLSMEGYGLRIKGIYIVNAPSFVDKILSLMKKTVREKIASRFFVCSSYDELRKEIPKEILPAEYGGDLESSLALYEKWNSTLKTKEAKEFIEMNNKLVSDDSKRSSYEFNAEYLGMPGSFSQLVVD